MEVIISWDEKALSEIHKILEYISEDSPLNAAKIADEIIMTFEKIKLYPLIYPADKYKKDTDNSYRYFELHKIRISYKVEEQRILVVRCRHTKQRPLYY